MKIHKSLLAALALAACLLVVTASAASAAVWKHHEMNVTKAIEIPMTGGEVFETGSGGMTCETRATIATSGGSIGTIKKWEVKKCSGGFGNLAGCEVLTTEAKSLPWSLHVNTTDLSVTGVRIRRTFKAGCAVKEIDKTVTLTLTLIPPSTITEIEFAGSSVGYKMFGSFTLDPPAAGTYGIG